MKNLIEIYENGRRQYGESPELFTDKGSWHSYINFYKDNFQQYSDVKLLEVGVRSGGSVWLWKNYFPKYEIWGVDILPDYYGNHSFTTELRSDPNIHIHWNSNSRVPTSFNSFPTDFDIIIDDGDHTLPAQLETLHSTWNLLKPGGMYIIEDVEKVGYIDLITEEVKKLSPASQITSFVYDKRYDDILVKIIK